jgi:MoaA/NifB/PqqE/SkfB family radical SAM enzyme
MNKQNTQPSLFPVHVFSENERNEVLLNNIVIDWYFGHQDILNSVIYPQIAVALVNELQNLSEQEIHLRFEKAKRKSLLMTALFVSGRCDANCEICYTDRKFRPDDITWEESRELLLQAIELGNKTIYIPGEGEPFLDDHFFDLIHFAQDYDQNVIIFTDGLLISDEHRFNKKWNKWGYSLDRFFDIIRNSSVYLYVKYWHSNKTKFCEMMGVHPDKLKTEPIELTNGSIIDVPVGILRLIKTDGEKVGIETAVHSLNHNDVLENIMPFVNDFGIKWYLEPIIHSGRYFGRHDYDLTSAQYAEILPFLTKQQCKRTGFSTVVMSSGHLSFCPSFVTNLSVSDMPALRELNIRNNGKDGGLRDIFTLLHTNRFLVESRYAAFSHPCLCEYFAKQAERLQQRKIA